MARLHLNDEVVELKDGSSIKEACEEAGVPFACAEGVCGVCLVEVREGRENLSEMTQEELDFLGETDGERLACQCKILRGDVKVSL